MATDREIWYEVSGLCAADGAAARPFHWTIGELEKDPRHGFRVLISMAEVRDRPFPVFGESRDVLWNLCWYLIHMLIHNFGLALTDEDGRPLDLPKPDSFYDLSDYPPPHPSTGSG